MTDAANTGITKGKLLMMAMVLATMLVALAATSKPAAAFDQVAAGRPGGVTPYQTQGYHYNPCVSNLPPITVCWRPYVYSQGPTVSRSPATTGNQIITTTHILYRWNGSSWVAEKHGVRNQTLRAGYSRIQTPNVSLLPNSTQGYYKVQIHVHWKNSSGSVLGIRELTYNHSGDYVCKTTRTCSVGAGWMYMS